MFHFCSGRKLGRFWLVIAVMKRSLLVLPILLTACSPEAAKPAAAPGAPSLLILQCDGLMVTVSHRGRVDRAQQRRTYRINLETKDAAVWNPEKKLWNESDGENTVDISEATITWSQVWSNDEAGKEAASSDYTAFDRALGTVTSTNKFLIPGATFDTKFEGQCIKVDEPSTERAF